MSTDDNDNGVPTLAPRVAFGANENETLNPVLDRTTTPYPTYIYERDISGTSNQGITANISIYRPNDVNMRFYKISLYPRYGEVWE